MCYLEKNNKLEGKKDLKNTDFSIYFPHGRQKKSDIIRFKIKNNNRGLILSKMCCVFMNHTASGLPRPDRTKRRGAGETYYR